MRTLALTLVAAMIGLSAPATAAAQGSTCRNDVSPTYTDACGPTFVLPGWGDAGGWTDPEQYETIQLADVDGDGDDELLGRTPAGIAVHDFDKTLGQWRPQVTPVRAPPPENDFHDVPVVLSEFANPPPLTDANPDPPATDWTRPEYYDTIQAADIDGQPGEEILARSHAGMIVFKYTPGTGGQAGSWRQLSTSGPLPDADGWNVAPYYYATIQTGDLDGDRDEELVARGFDGVWAYNWVGSGWKVMTPGGTRLFPDTDQQKDPAYYTSLQLADVDGRPGDELIGRDIGGVASFAFRAGAFVRIDRRDPPFSDQPEQSDCPFVVPGNVCFNSGPAYYSTIQLADVDGDRRAELLGRALDGLRARHYDDSSSTAPPQWHSLPTLAAVSDSAGWAAEKYYSTLQFADINGDNRAEALGRGGQGIVAWSYDPTAKAWRQLTPSTGVGLADDPWGTDRSYYATIQTGDVDGDKRADLIARGPYGIRTWFFNRRGTGGWERYLPEGGYPDFPCAGSGSCQKAAFEELNRLVAPPGGGSNIRDAWLGENPPRSTDLGTLQNTLVTVGGCTGLGPQQPPQPPHYATCTPPAGTSGFSAADWTAVLNQIFAELHWAQQVVAHYAELQVLRGTLFLEQGATLPAIGDDLKLSAAQDSTTTFNGAELYSVLFQVVGSVASVGLPEVGVALGVAGEILSMVPSASSTLAETFEGTYAALEAKLAASFDDVDKALGEHSQLVRQDYRLLTLVGQLRDRGTWTLDDVGMKSAGRQGFTLGVYKALLPALYARYVISGCTATQVLVCVSPKPGPWTTGPGESFTAIGAVPTKGIQSSPCWDDISEGIMSCTFVPPPSDLVEKLWGTLSRACAYQPGNPSTAWTFDCNLGIDPRATLGDPGVMPRSQAWNFPIYTGSPKVPSGLGGRAVVGGAGGVLRLSGTVALPRRVRLARARVTHERLLHEAAGAGELVRRRSGARLSPLTLSRRKRGAVVRHLFASASRRGPTTRMRLWRSSRRSISFDLRLRGVRLSLPNACSGTRPGVDLATAPIPLHTRLRIDDGRRRPLRISLHPEWRCRRDRLGRVRRLVLHRPSVRTPKRRGLVLAMRGPRHVRAGGIATYRVTVTNRRPTAAHQVRMTGLVSHPSRAPRAVLRRLGALPPGRSKTVRLRVRSGRSTAGRACVSVTTQAIDTRPSRKRRCTRIAGSR